MIKATQTLWLSAVLVTLAWGVGAFGSPYPWAYVPLLVASAALGIAGLFLGPTKAKLPALLQLSLILIVAAVGTQMIPLPLKQLETFSPHAATILSQQSIEFSLGQVASHPLSIDPSRTQLGLTFFVALALLLLGTARILRREAAGRLVRGLVILGVMVAVVGIVQRAVFNGKVYGFWENVQGGLVFGPFINRNHFAGWMLMVIPVALGYFLAMVSRGMEGRKAGLRNYLLWFASGPANRAVLTGFAILVMALSLVLTLSRSGILALFVAMLIAATVMVSGESGVSRRAVAIGYVVFLLVAVVWWVGLDQLTSRFAEADITSIDARPAIWADTFRIVKDFWLTGTGLNTYGVSTLLYQTASPERHLREAHNDYLQLAAEGGLLLGVPIAISILAFARVLCQRVREDVGSIGLIRMGAITALIAIALQSIVDFSLQMPGNAAMFAVIAGLAIHDGRRV